MINKDVNLRPFQTALRKLGFKRMYNMRSTINPDCQMYECEFPEHEVKLEVQLWGDGHHRVAYWHENLFVPERHRGKYGVMDTLPTSFDGVPQMLAAIEYQKKKWLERDKEEHKRRVDQYFKTSVGMRHEQEQRTPRLH